MYTSWVKPLHHINDNNEQYCVNPIVSSND